jgi:diguanylate cyclase (GGDEF)-like protein/PAS domain S-box-containing protein
MLLSHIKPAPAHLGRFGRRVALPVAVLVTGAMALVTIFVLVTSARQDAIALDASTRLARTALTVKEREIGRNLKDYAVWEDAYRNLHLRLNLDWAGTDGNVGANIHDSLGYEMAFVVGPDGRTAYAVLEGEPQPADAFALIPHGMDRLVAQARRATEDDKPVVGLLRSGGGIVLVAAAALLPPPGSAEPPPPQARSVLIFAKRLGREFLTRIGTEYLLAGLTLRGPEEPADGASLPLATPDGVTLGHLTWKPERPGRELLRVLLPPLGIALLGLAAFAGLVLRNARRSAQAIEASARTIEAYAQTLETSEARFRDVAEASSDWIWETDPELRLTYLSARFSEVTGVAAAAVLGKTLDQFFSSDAASDGWALLRGDTEAHGAFRDLRCRYRDAAGASRICRLAGRPILGQDEAFQGYRGTAADITAEVEAQARANHLALHDPLTELPNRVMLRERLDLALAAVRRRQSRVAVLCLDLDHFKEVNDTLGHGAGDLLLKEVAQRLQAGVRGTDTVARLGGDEFAIVQVSVDQPGDAQALCRRLTEELRAPFRIEGHELYVGASIGVALAPDDGENHERLLKSADIALYRAKQAGRGTFRFFEAQMDSELQARKALEQDLRQALAKGQFELHYQPLVAVQGQELTGVEALLRWRHPDRGVVQPGEFIPVAEETGLIVPIGEWALRTACRQVKAWPGLRVSVNLSPVQFKHRELVDTIKQVIADADLEPERLELEITENVLLHDTASALEVLTTLKELGVRISMDDFGTGYSSLGYLNSFPFDKIKIDRSFIIDLNEKDKANAIVRSVINLGQSLGMITNAEGVETLEQLMFLANEGCEQVQGYYFGRAMPAGEISALIANWERSCSSAA